MPSWGSRDEFDGRSVVISGDTKASENLVKYAKGTDLLLHNVVTARDELIEKSVAVRTIMSRLARPDHAGEVFTRVAPKLAAYYHLVFQSTPEFPPQNEKDIVDITRRTYSGPLVVSADLMSFIIARDGVRTVQPPAARAP
jgi:ribonuclease Z